VDRRRNPTPADIRENRLPIVTKDEDDSNLAAAAAKTAAPTANARRPRKGLREKCSGFTVSLTRTRTALLKRAICGPFFLA